MLKEDKKFKDSRITLCEKCGKETYKRIIRKVWLDNQFHHYCISCYRKLMNEEARARGIVLI